MNGHDEDWQLALEDYVSNALFVCLGLQNRKLVL